MVEVVRKRITLKNPPPELQARLRAETRSVNDIATQALAARYRLPVPPTGRPARGTTGDPIILKVPLQIWQATKAESLRTCETMRIICIDALTRHLKERKQ